MTNASAHYIPAAGHHWALPLYDSFTKLFGADRVRGDLLAQADLEPGQRVLDVGCGTGTFAVQIKRSHPGVEVVALDPDPSALARGRRKAERAGVAIQFEQGFADRLPYPDANFDRVFSSFMFHHLQGEEKAKLLREVRRVLKPGGRFKMLDFAGPEAGKRGFLSRLIHSQRVLKDNASDQVLSRMREAELLGAEQVGQRPLLMGHVAYYRAERSMNTDR